MRCGALAASMALVALAAAADTAVAQIGGDTVILTWTAPGNDSLRGAASAFDIRMSRFPITEQTWHTAWRIGLLRADRAGTVERFRVSGLIPGLDYYFAVKTVDFALNWSRVSNVAIRRNRTADGEPAPTFDMAAPHPNPATSVTRFTVTLERAAPVQADVFDASGRRVRVLASGILPPGPTELTWDLNDEHGRTLPTGMYLLRVRQEGNLRVRRMVISR